MYQILGYLEEGAIKNSVIDTINLKDKVIPLYSCPSRRNPTFVGGLMTRRTTRGGGRAGSLGNR